MLFLQGTRDKLADLDLMRPLTKKLGPKVFLDIVDGADHGFSVLKKHHMSTAEVRKDLAVRTRKWYDQL